MCIRKARFCIHTFHSMLRIRHGHTQSDKSHSRGHSAGIPFCCLVEYGAHMPVCVEDFGI